MVTCLINHRPGGDAARSGGNARVPELAPIRHARMLVSPFTFHRGAALVMAADLAGTPASGHRAPTEKCDAEIAVPPPPATAFTLPRTLAPGPGNLLLRVS